MTTEPPADPTRRLVLVGVIALTFTALSLAAADWDIGRWPGAWLTLIAGVYFLLAAAIPAIRRNR